MKALALTIALGGCLAVAGCGGGGDSSPGASAAAETAASRSTADAPGPEVKIPPGQPPKRIVVKDLRKGTGARAKVGYEATIRYVGVRWNGQTYSNAWTLKAPPRFVLGAHELSNRALDRGIRGMRVGGRREIILPPSAYTEAGSHDLSPPQVRELTLVYVVDLLKLQPAFEKRRLLTGH